MMTRIPLINLLIVLLISLGSLAKAQQPVQTPPPAGLCGMEKTVGDLRILVACPDYPTMRALTGFTGFPEQRGQQVFLRTTDTTVAGFRVALTYRAEGAEKTVVQWADVNPSMDSGVGWVLGDVQIVSIVVTPLRETARLDFR